MRKEISLAALAVFAVSLGLVVNAQDADAAAYIKFDGVDGEATDQNHDKWIDILSFEQTISRESSSSGATRQRASPVFGDIVLVKELDKSSPKIAEAIAMGKVFPSVNFEITSDGVAYLKYELKNVMVTSYSISGDADDRPTEEVAFNFEEIKVTYSENDSSGKSKGNVEYSWKVEAGEK